MSCWSRSLPVFIKRFGLASIRIGLEKSLAIMATMPPLPSPVVVILGSTASGKSQLAIDLAKRVDGEVISADSMQVYEGLDILTNKATQEEMEGIPHHMIGVVPRNQPFNVVKFQAMALPLVEGIRERGKVPFIVGGTNYYIESLLWKVLMNENSGKSDSTPPEGLSAKKQKLGEDSVEATPILEYLEGKKGMFTEPELTEKWSDLELHQALKIVDPKRALKVHPRDRRKVVRSLQVYFRTGKQHSLLIDEQCVSGGGGGGDSETDDQSLRLGGPLRYSNIVCFWIQADRQILNDRINNRVGKMVERGIQKEIDDYVDSIRVAGEKWDFEQGVMQSIGVKEFEEYIQLSPDLRSTEKGRELFKDGLERLKVVTRQYAKKQVQWVAQRFLKGSRRQLPPVYGLDGNKTDDDSWRENVTKPATEILEAYLNGEVTQDVGILKDKRVQVEKGEEEEDLISRKCDPCGKILLGSFQWKEHVRSGRHWKVVKKRKQEMERLSSLLESRSRGQDVLVEGQ